MIISASRIATASGSGAVGAHVFSGPKNESITVVQGARADLDDMMADARQHGAKYGIRHIKISPAEATTRDQALAVAAALGKEFGFDPGRGVLVEHEKRRQGGAGFDRHWHLMVPEVDPVRGRVLDAHWMRARHEKVSRVAEIELGHHQVQGRWNKAVEAALRAEGRGELADRVQPLAAGDRPAEAFTAVRHQVAERRGASMPEMKAAVADAWQRSDSGPAFRAALAEQGLTARPGDKKGVWLIETAGADGAPVLVGSLARLTRAKAEEVGARMAAPTNKETAHGNADTPGPRHSDDPDGPGDLERRNRSARAPGAAEADGRIEDRRDPGSAPADPDGRAADRSEARLSPADRSLELGLAARPEAIAELRALAATLGAPAEKVAAPGKAVSGAVPPAEADEAATISVRPYDPTRDGDWLRFLNESTQALNKRADAGPPTTKGQPDADAGRTAAVGARFRAALTDALRQPATAQAVVGGGPEGSPGDGRAGQPVDASGDRPEGVGARSVRGDPSSDRGGFTPPAPQPVGAEGIRDEPARPGDQAPRDDRGEPDQDRAARG